MASPSHRNGGDESLAGSGGGKKGAKGKRKKGSPADVHEESNTIAPFAAKNASAAGALAGIGNFLSAAAGGAIGIFRRKKAAEAADTEREEWEDFDLADFLKEVNIREAPAAAAKHAKPPTPGQQLPGMSAHPDNKDMSFEELMAEYQRFEAVVDQGGGGAQLHADVVGHPVAHEAARAQHRPASRDQEALGGTGILKRQEQRQELLKSRGGKDPTSRVKIEDGDNERRAEVREARTAGATTAGGDTESRPGTVRWGVNTASSFGERADTAGSESHWGAKGRPDTQLSAMSFQSAVSGRLDIEPMGDALMFDQPGFFNGGKRDLISIPMYVYSEIDFGGPCLVLWAHQNRIKWLPEVVGRLTALTELRLHHNQLEEVPPEFALLRSLKKLWLNDNNLKKCPDEIGHLTTLEMLSLSRNPFDELTTGVGRLIRLKDMMLDSLALKVPPAEIVVRGPKKIVEYMGKIREAEEACQKFRASTESGEHEVEDDSQMVVWRLNSDAPTQDDVNFWRKRSVGIDTKGMLCYSLAIKEEEEKEWVEIGNIRQVKITKEKNKINYPLQISIASAKISMILALDRQSQRDKFLKMLRAAQSNTLCNLELRGCGLLKVPFEVVRMSELTALDLSNNQIKALPRMMMPLLETLVLDRNGFSAVPRTIYEDLTCIARLSLMDNPIVRLPTNIGDMPMIRNLDMNVNFQLESPPTIVMSQGLQLRFLKSMRHSERTGSLDLSNFSLTEVPHEIGKRWSEHPEFHNLHTLKLRNNRLLDIDQGVDKYRNVVSLDLRENRVTRLPKQFGVMLHLIELYLDNNELRELPKSMKSMTKLVTLTADQNEIYNWPWCLEYLTSLTELHLDHNQIENVPAVCSTLHALRELHLSGNKIRTLPVEVNGWSSLTELKMDKNCLPHLPETLGQLENLEFMSFAGNDIDAFPTEVGNWVQMKSLDLSGNKIPYLPEAICNSTSLKKLLLEGNPLVQLPLAMGCMRSLKKLSFTGAGAWISPPNEIISRGYHHVIHYLQRYDDAWQSNSLDLSKMKHEFLHADILALSNLTRLNLSDNLLQDLTVVIGEANGRWTRLKGDRDLYLPEIMFQEKRRAKDAMLDFLGEGLNNRQLKQRSEKIFSQIDMDGGGTLGMEELDLAFRRMGCKVSREVLHMMVMEVSNDGDDEVDQEEWEWLVANIYRGKKDAQGIGDLKNLEFLDISRNQLRRLPYGLGFCTALKNLIIDDRDFITIPCDDILRTCGQDASILTRYLRQFHEACISHNLELNGFIIHTVPKEVFELTSLTELHMSGNSIKVLGAEVEALECLRFADLSYNRIKSIPATIGKLRNLEELDVQCNALLHLPPIICAMDNLKLIHVVGNKSLSVPREVQNAGTPTLKLFLKGMHTGANDSVVDWSELNKLKVAKLRSVPDVLFTMNWIADLNLDGNSVHRLPQEFGSLKALTRLSARFNLIEKLPAEIKKCRCLDKLYLDHNRLQSIPTSLYTHLPLNVLGLTHNNLDSGCIPEDLQMGAASKLQALTLDHNNLGKLSSSLQVFLSLKMLTFNYNTVGSLPHELGACTALTDLQFDANDVEELPAPMQNLTNLVRLKLNDNKISNLPDWVGKFTKLQHLSLGNNHLQFIPYPISHLNLSIFTIDGNPLSAIETGVLMEGPKEVVDFISYNHNYDVPNSNLIPDPMEQRRQINAHVNTYDHEIHRLQESRLEAEYKNVGGYSGVEIAYNKRVGEDRTEGSGAVILDEEMLREVQVCARILCQSLLYIMSLHLLKTVLSSVLMLAL